MRKAFVDLGANVGEISAKFAAEHPDFEIFAFEVNKDLEPNLAALKERLGDRFHYWMKAAWILDGEIKLYKSGHHQASTIRSGKEEPEGWAPIDYSSFDLAPCVDISGWLDREFRLGDHVVMKIDVEGAEYQIVQKMIYDGTIFKLSELICEWHAALFPHQLDEEHDMIYEKAGRCVRLVDWV